MAGRSVAGRPLTLFCQTDDAMLKNSMHLQTSPAIFAIPVARTGDTPATVGIYEFFSKSFAYCPIETLYWLSYFMNPRTLAETKRDHLTYSEQSLDTEIAALVDANFLIDAESACGKSCDDYRTRWKWDITTAAFHFTVLNNSFCTPEESIDKQLVKLVNEPQPQFHWSPGTGVKVALPRLKSEVSIEMLRLLASRRTVRHGGGGMIDFGDLSSCLVASFGIVSHVKSTTGYLPLTMTPSGGARNPYEAFVVVKRCESVAPGVYRYCANEHVLELVRPSVPEDSVAHFFQDQQWFDEMAVIVVMVAVLERTMWKYQDPNAYRVLLMEAGHKAQNFMIMATHLGLTSCPTAALAHDELAGFLMLEDKLMQVPIYAFSLNASAPNTDEIVPNPVFAELLG
jgi:SagB-type dehydrogenase family enzyme